jgi:putative endonuclease
VSEPPHLAIGRAAESAAARHLERAGYLILATNFRARGGELDVVAKDGAALAIVEVRYRGSDRFGGGAASITMGKRRRIVRAARVLLATNPPLARLPARFDVVEVTGPADALDCRLIRGAFSL